jgi:hypothetical protein
MPKLTKTSAKKTDPTPAPAAEPKPPSRKILMELCRHAAGLLADANDEMDRMRTQRNGAIGYANSLRNEYEAAVRAFNEDRQMLINQVRELEIRLAESNECLRRACLYHHTTAIALQSAQAHAGQDAYQPIDAAVQQQIQG